MLAIMGYACETHFAAGINTKTVRTLHDLSGVLHFALSINLGGAVVRMQEIIRAVVAERAVITRVAPPATSERFRRHDSLRPGPRLLHKRHVLLSLPKGNILRRDRVEVFVTARVRVNETLVKDVVAESCADVFWGTASQVQRADGQIAADMSTSSICSMASVAWRPCASRSSRCCHV